MGKTFKDNKAIKEFVKPSKSLKVKLSYEDKLELKKLKDDLYWERLMKYGFS